MTLRVVPSLKGVAAVTVGTSAPVAPVAGALWLDTGATSATFPIQYPHMAIGNGIDVIAVGFGPGQEFECPYAGTIFGWTILGGGVTGSIVLDLWRDSLANYPPTVADTITASAKPTLTSAKAATSTTLTGWNTTFAAGDIFWINVDSVSLLKAATLVLHIQRSA